MGGVEVYLQSFPISKQVKGEWSAPRPVRFSPPNKEPAKPTE